MAMLAALLLFVPSVAQAQDSQAILRDCADDSILQGDYSASAMRSARDDIPAELDEYSDCRDVLSREIAAKTSVPKDNGGGSSVNGGGGGTGGDTSGGTTTSTDPAPIASAAPSPASTPTGRDPGIAIGPSTDQDWQAIGNAAKEMTPVEVNGRTVEPVASVGRNGLPGTVVAVLALLAVAAFSVTVPFVRRRVVARSSPA